MGRPISPRRLLRDTLRRTSPEQKSLITANTPCSRCTAKRHPNATRTVRHQDHQLSGTTDSAAVVFPIRAFTSLSLRLVVRGSGRHSGRLPYQVNATQARYSWSQSRETKRSLYRGLLAVGSEALLNSPVPQNPPTLPRSSRMSRGLISVIVCRESGSCSSSICRYA